MLLIYTHHKSERLSYIVEQLFEDWYGVNTVITTDKVNFQLHNGPRISYSLQPFHGNAITIEPAGPLEETDITIEPPQVSGEKERTRLFPTSKEGFWPFDLFSAAFWLLSRYEEYQPHTTDKFDRFEADQSLAHKLGFLNLPLIQYWMEELFTALKERFPAFEYTPPPLTPLTTIDVDQAYAFRHRGFLQQWLTAANSLVKGRTNFLRRQWQALLMPEKDPYNTYAYLQKKAQEHHTKFYFFFLVGDKTRFDENISGEAPAMKALIKETMKHHHVGIHPSFYSINDPSLPEKEIRRMERIMKEKPLLARQHYIRTKMPESYQSYLSNGIAHDYSMGYASMPGFRASTALPFRWFDLSRNKITSLVLHPFCYMDVSLLKNKGLSVAEAIVVIDSLYNEIKQRGGEFIHIWHNNTVSGFGPWEDWSAVFEHTLFRLHNTTA